MIFAKALDKVEEIFKKDNLISEIVNKNELFKKLIRFLQRSYNDVENISTFKLILKALGNYIQIRERSTD